MTPDRRQLSYFEIIAACAGSGCPLCRLNASVVQRYLSAIVYESINDPAATEQLSRSLGYCHEHAWRLPEVSGGVALGVALVYRDILTDLGGSLERAVYDRQRPVRTALALQPRLPYPACTQRDELDEAALNALVQAFARRDNRLQSALQASAGLETQLARLLLEICQLADAFDLTPETVDLARQARSELAVAWADLADTLSPRLRRYGPMDPSLAIHLDPRLRQLIQATLELSQTLASPTEDTRRA